MQSVQATQEIKCRRFNLWCGNDTWLNYKLHSWIKNNGQAHFTVSTQIPILGKKKSTNRMETWQCVCPIFCHNDGPVVELSKPSKLSLKLSLDDLRMSWVLVPAVVAIDAGHVHKGVLKPVTSGCSHETFQCTAGRNWRHQSWAYFLENLS